MGRDVGEGGADLRPRPAGGAGTLDPEPELLGGVVGPGEIDLTAGDRDRREERGRQESQQTLHRPDY